MTRTSLLIISLTAVAFPLPVHAQAGDSSLEQDQICQLLFDNYLSRPVKADTRSIMAATHIVAKRSHNNGFWKVVFHELKQADPGSEINCVRVLGKVLAIDAAARDVIRRQKETGEMSAWLATVVMPPEVVTELIERGKKADRHRVDHYAIALARARMPATRDFLKSILEDADGRNHMPGTKFHAAVGLAQLNEAAGIEWLIMQADNPLSTVSNAWPHRVKNYNVSTCSVAALRHISGRDDLSTGDEWRQWWRSANRLELPVRPVELVDP